MAKFKKWADEGDYWKNKADLNEILTIMEMCSDFVYSSRSITVRESYLNWLENINIWIDGKIKK